MVTSQNILSLVHRRRIIAERRHERKKSAAFFPENRRRRVAECTRLDTGADALVRGRLRQICRHQNTLPILK